MGQVKADMQGASAPSSAARTPAVRPLSPHLPVWRWPSTRLGSILHRMTGIALYVGAFIAAGWALALASGPEWYGRVMGWLAHPLGRLVLAGLTLAFFFHLANGVRHLVWDAGRGLNPKLADMMGLAVMVFAVLATAGVWWVALLTGAI
jgi:succinate dehydrogenase / fumarate reductase cytochrome b subunit